jgi:hypothetical protein
MWVKLLETPDFFLLHSLAHFVNSHQQKLIQLVRNFDLSVFKCNSALKLSTLAIIAVLYDCIMYCTTM